MYSKLCTCMYIRILAEDHRDNESYVYWPYSTQNVHGYCQKMSHLYNTRDTHINEVKMMTISFRLALIYSMKNAI